MNLLLDTHIALWAVFGHRRLPPRARALISDPQNAVTVSVASLWEIAIKHAIVRAGVRAIPVSANEAFGHFERAGYALLAISSAHARAVETLPPHHKDPFDRMLIAQALSEPMRLLTHDPGLARYSDTIIGV